MVLKLTIFWYFLQISQVIILQKIQLFVMRDAITTVRISIKSFIIVNNTFISKIKLLIMISMILFASAGYAQNKPTDANIVGHVVDAENGEHLPYATVQIKGTTIGVVTDETGIFNLLILMKVNIY